MSKPRKVRGNFRDLSRLLDEVDRPLIIPMHEPNRAVKRLSDKLARCPAAHNRLLLGEQLH